MQTAGRYSGRAYRKIRREGPRVQILLVGLASFKLNSALAAYLREHPASEVTPAAPQSESAADGGRPPSYVAPCWRLGDRLSDDQVRDLIDGFMRGTTKHVLAKRYGIGLTSVKKILRDHGVRRASRDGQKPELDGG